MTGLSPLCFFFFGGKALEHVEEFHAGISVLGLRV